MTDPRGRRRQGVAQPVEHLQRGRLVDLQVQPVRHMLQPLPEGRIEAEADQPFQRKIEKVVFAGGHVDHIHTAPGGAVHGGAGRTAGLGRGKQDHPAKRPGCGMWQSLQGHAGPQRMSDDVDLPVSVDCLHHRGKVGECPPRRCSAAIGALHRPARLPPQPDRQTTRAGQPQMARPTGRLAVSGRRVHRQDVTVRAVTRNPWGKPVAVDHHHDGGFVGKGRQTFLEPHTVDLQPLSCHIGTNRGGRLRHGGLLLRLRHE